MMDSTCPQVSILIPTYNRAHFLPQAIETSLAQDYPNLEIIVSDNHSTDATQECVKKYMSDPRFRYFRNDVNLGSGPNYKKLLYSYASGQYAKYLTDDDYLIDNGHVSRAMDIILRHGVKIVFSAAISRFEYEEHGIDLSFGLDEIVPRQWWLDNLCRSKHGLAYFPSCGSGTVFEIAKAKQLHAFEGKCYGDYEFAIQCMISEEQTGYIRQPSYVERRHSGQDGRTSYDHAFKGACLFNDIYEMGCRCNIDSRTMENIRQRGLKFFARGFLVQNWVSENGRSPLSFVRFLKSLRKINAKLPQIALWDIQVPARFLLSGSRLYSFVRNIRYCVISRRQEV
jgi:glycosyltransferase involved in cell wall biosynthesis